MGCQSDPDPVAPVHRPTEPWAFRSVLDRQPRMLTLALDSTFYAAYDLAHARLYKVWKGGVLMEGAPYTSRKNVQPTSWGATYWSDSTQQARWVIESDGDRQSSDIINQGYVLKDDRIRLQYALVLSSGDTVQLTEQPEFVRNDNGEPGLERVFTAASVPENTTISLQSRDTTFTLDADGPARWTMYFDPLPPQSPPVLQEAFDHRGYYWMEKSGCFTCHELDEYTVGPPFRQVAARYRGQRKKAIPQLTQKVKAGGNGVWGTTMMNPHPQLSDEVIKIMLDYIFTLKPDGDATYQLTSDEEPVVERVAAGVASARPGHGSALDGLHPSYDLTTLHRPDFQPKVGGLAFLPDGRLLVTTWDTMGGVYVLDSLDTTDPSNVSVKRIASGLAEPLGIEVVDGEIFVLQKQELTHLIDHNGDDIIDEYRTVSDRWEVSDDFHEFSFGLVHLDGYFYATLSMAMRLIGDEQQKLDRGRTIKISPDGSYDWINYGLRTPNGIGLGADDALFVTDNQGQWLPSNKLVHVKEGEYLGMAWGLLDSMTAPPVAPPAVYLPEDEIGNSPSEPILMQDGPYRGQLLHGDVTHGGIKRDFLEKIDGEYQGAVFRFTQGLAAGVNRLCWGPDGALYVGEVGMVGGWSWQGKKFGLQRMHYNGTPTFEMLAIRAQPNGFEIELTEPLEGAKEWQAADFLVQQWWYQPTADYGGPKMDLETLAIAQLTVSEDRTKIFLEIPGLKEGRVVYFRLPKDMASASGQPLWSSESWYTLNRIPR